MCHCSRSGRESSRAATTVRCPTSARACSSGSPALTAQGCRARHSYDPLATMPELPEVETIRRQLAPHLEGRTLESVEIDDYRWTQPAPPELIAAELTGARIEKLGRLGKYLIWELDGDRHLLVHLRMTGALLLDAEDPPHARVRFELDDG